VVLQRHVEHELRALVGFQQVEHVVVGGAVGGEPAQRVGVRERPLVCELVEAQLLVHAVATPVRALGGVHGMGGVSERREVRHEALRSVKVVQHVGVHAAAEVPHARSREELELAVARAPAERRRVCVARFERLGRDIVVMGGTRVGAGQARVAREVGERLVHDRDDGRGFGAVRHARAIV